MEKTWKKTLLIVCAFCGLTFSAFAFAPSQANATPIDTSELHHRFTVLNPISFTVRNSFGDKSSLL